MKLQLALFALLIPVAAHADDFTQTRARYAAVDKAVPKATVVKRELEGYSAEGGELTAYFQKGVPLKMIARHYGESGRATNELYFWNGALFFVLRTTENYEKLIGEAGSPGKITRSQARYYFSGGEITRLIDADGETIRGGADFERSGKENLQFAREMLAGARKPSKTIVAPR